MSGPWFESAVDQLVARVKTDLDLPHLRLGSEYGYAHLALAVIDAVFSIGIRYETTQAVVARYAQARNLHCFRSDNTRWPDPADQEPLGAALEFMSRYTDEALADRVFQNFNLTATKSGILKAEAVRRTLEILTSAGVQYFQDLPRIVDDTRVEDRFLAIPGERSGLAWDYFWMLAGDESLIKPDRHVMRYLNYATRRSWTPSEAVTLVRAAVRRLELEGFDVSPRLLDYGIWQWARRYLPSVR